jgi:hypothetical protein
MRALVAFFLQTSRSWKSEDACTQFCFVDGKVNQVAHLCQPVYFEAMGMHPLVKLIGQHLPE